ncbi:MAG TPA: hypothetical protein VFW00_04865 [Rhodocyclaceae bacterium]|nr:hypothetical protein [Rhodocyclaceae bacterium]
MSWIHARLRALPLWIRLGIPISMVVWLSISLIVFLNYYNYYKAFHELTLARYLVLGKDLRQTVEVGLAVGLSPRDNAQLEPILKQAQTKLPNIRFVALVDEAGKIIRSVGQLDNSAAEWIAPHPVPEGSDHWQASDTRSYQIGLPYRNSFDQPGGAVIVGYERNVVDAAMWQTRSLLFRDAALVAVMALLLVLVGTWILTRKFERGLAAASHAITQALGKEPIDSSGFQVLGPEVANGIPEFVNASRRAFGQLEVLGKKVKSS